MEVHSLNEYNNISYTITGTWQYWDHLQNKKYLDQRIVTLTGGGCLTELILLISHSCTRNKKRKEGERERERERER